MSSEPIDQEHLTNDEFEQLVASRARQRRRTTPAVRYPGIPDEARLWMALTPGWTVPLAEHCSYPGITSIDAKSLFDRMVEADLVQARQLISRAGDIPALRFYVMNSISRAETLNSFVRTERLPQEAIRESVRHDPTGPAVDFRDTLAAIGRSILDTSLEPPFVPQQVLDWAELASQAKASGEMVRTFNKRIDEMFRRRDESALLNWIEVARPLAELLQVDRNDTLQFALQRAGRQLELVHRRKMDTGETMEPISNILTVRQLATYLNMASVTIYRLAARGKLPGTKVGGQWRFYKQAIDEWLSRKPDRKRTKIFGRL